MNLPILSKYTQQTTTTMDESTSYAHEQGLVNMQTIIIEEEQQQTTTSTSSLLDYSSLVNDLRTTFNTQKTLSYEWRMNELAQLKRMVCENEKKMCEAVMKDLGRCEVEAFGGEVMPIIIDIDFVMSNLKSWMASESITHELLVQPGTSKIVKQPKGVVLIIGPWNFPVRVQRKLSRTCIYTHTY
jgi:acyl-CoA reductase-like NAD-dependent aldehyde dehydrogenase